MLLAALFSFEEWSTPIEQRVCSPDRTPKSIPIGGHSAALRCSTVDGALLYRFPPGIYELGVQWLVPERTTIVGASPPNDETDPRRSPDWRNTTLFLATSGVSDYKKVYCHAHDMVTTRVGFVLSSHVTVRDVAYQGLDTISPADNGALCGGGAFETKGCAENDCSRSDVNNGGSDGMGSVNVTIEGVRVNDFFHGADRAKIGAAIENNTQCDGLGGCCFCQANGVRATQTAVWVPATRNVAGTRSLRISNLVSRATQADGINLHGAVHDAVVERAWIENTGDDVYALWGADAAPGGIIFANSTARNPGVMRPGWYGNCVATYGLKDVVFRGLRCQAPMLLNKLPNYPIDTSFFVVFTSFGAKYPRGNSLTIDGWTFSDLDGKPYTAADGSIGKPARGKMAWSSAGGVVAPFYFQGGESQKVNINVRATL